MKIAGRLSGCLFVLTAALMPRAGSAQDVGPYSGHPGAAWGQPGAMFVPPPPAGPPGYGPVDYGPGGAVGSGNYYDAHGAEYWEGPSPLETSIAHYLQNGGLRLEWLSWSIQEPGNTRLGAPLDLPQNPLTGIPDPRLPFPVFDNQIPPVQIGEAAVPSLADTEFSAKDGLRGTMILPFYRGDFEVSVFALEEAEDLLSVRGLRPQEELFLGATLIVTPGVFAATSLLENGEPSDLLLLYNQSFDAFYTSNVWGAEGIFVADAWSYSMPIRSEALSVRPLMGFRFLDIDEQLTQVGVFDNPIDVTPSLTSVIDSVANNDLYGGILGFRAELVDKWFTLGVEPRATLGWNYYEAIVSTDNLRSVDDPTTRTTDSAAIFSPILEVKTYGKVHFHKNFSMWVGYDFLQAFRVTRPDKNIVYDSRGAAAPPAIRVDTEIDSLVIQGLSVGGEFIFR